MMTSTDFDTSQDTLWRAKHLKERKSDKTECGMVWEELPTGCYICNGGPHYHYADGSCDTEPCYRHGGPA